MLDPDRLLAHLRQHIGQANGITAKSLVAEINRVAGKPICNEREMRKAVEVLRVDGHHVCAHPARGYFIADTAEELEATIQYLHSRAMKSLRQISAMKRVSMPDLLGQMRFRQ